jgi:hypothetical protein
MRSIRLLAIFLAYAAFVASEAQAQSIGAGIGIVKLEQDDESSRFLTANVRFPLLGPLQLEPEVGYWKRTETVPAGELSFEDFSLGVNALLVVPGTRFQVWGGAGLGAHFLDRTAGIAQIIRDAKSTDIAVHVLGGLDFKLSGPLVVFGVARRDVFGDSSDARDQTKFYGGLRLSF